MLLLLLNVFYKVSFLSISKFIYKRKSNINRVYSIAQQDLAIKQKCYLGILRVSFLLRKTLIRLLC